MNDFSLLCLWIFLLLHCISNVDAVIWWKKKESPKNPLQNTKPLNPFPAVMGLPSFGLLVPAWDVDLPVYRMLLSGAAALCKCGKMHVVMPPSTPSDSAFCCPESSVQHNQQLLSSHWFFVICTTSLLKTQTKWVKKTCKYLVFSLKGGI